LRVSNILYRFDSRVSRLRTFQLTGTLPYTGFILKCPNISPLYILYISSRLYSPLPSVLYYTVPVTALIRPKVLFTALLFTKIACVGHAPIPCRVGTSHTPSQYIYPSFQYIYIKARTHALLLYNSPFQQDRQSFHYIYISFDSSILPTFFRNFFTTQVRRPNQSSFFSTIRYMQPVSALSPSFFSSSS
jgi:hypothetical protein